MSVGIYSWAKTTWERLKGLTNGTTYTVKAGDTLSKIAQRYYGNGGLYMKIYEANRDQLTNPDLIHPGQVLRIPK